MHTQPMPLDAMDLSSNGLSEFLVSTPTEIAALLRQCAEGDVLIGLSSPSGAHYTSTVWAVDESRGQLSLTAEPNDVALQRLMEDGEVVAVGYLDSVKVQFDLRDLVLVRSVTSCVLKAAMPQRVYRFQRRSGFRVRPVGSKSPLARLRHPAIPDMQLALRVIDVSIGGVALFLPDDVPAVEPGSEIADVLIELDGDTRFRTGIVVHHVTLLNHESKGARLGCGLVKIEAGGARSLQLYIDQTQKRRRLLSL
jgi:c-di-GMP-binding flagellar brake protein YcgR